MILTVNNHSYKASRSLCDLCINMAKEKYPVNSIVAVEKMCFMDMKRERYNSVEELEKATREYEELGFTVYSTKEEK